MARSRNFQKTRGSRSDRVRLTAMLTRAEKKGEGDLDLDLTGFHAEVQRRSISFMKVIVAGNCVVRFVGKAACVEPTYVRRWVS
jgi:hypothetical protein